jgi:hypothetical protein
VSEKTYHDHAFIALTTGFMMGEVSRVDWGETSLIESTRIGDG